MKKFTKKLVASMLSTAMLMGMSLTAFAANSQTQGISVNGYSGPGRQITNTWSVAENGLLNDSETFDFALEYTGSDAIGTNASSTPTFNGSEMTQNNATKTAQIVLKNRGIPIITDERLVEMSFGDYEGIENSFKIPDCPINLIFRKPEEYIESIGGAETFAELFARTGSFLKEVIEPQLQEGKDILIVGHGAMNSSIICQVKNKPIEEFWSAGLEQCKILQL